MKILYVTTMGGTMIFFNEFIKGLIEAGHSVDIASNTELFPVPSYYEEWGCNIFSISCTRTPFNKGTVRAVGELKKLVAENNYDIVHCHTPIAAMCTRLACRKARKKYGMKVFYTAHGFHFFKGAPLKNWLVYFPVEWFCSFFTDTLITINQEDYAFAKKHMHAKNIEYVHGVGVDVDKYKYSEIDIVEKRKELGIPEESVAVLSVGELNDNKNHETVLRAIAKLERKDIVYVICGVGDKKENLESLAKELGMEKRFILAGYRTDLVEVYKCCDMFAFPSKREGLPVSVMEAMASGLPCVVSDIRGNRDLISDGENGFWCKVSDLDAFSDRIGMLATDALLRKGLIENSQNAVKKYSFESVRNEMERIYVK